MCSVGSDIAVNEMFDRFEIVENIIGTSRRNIDACTIGLSLCEGKDGRWWYLVGFETNESTVDIEERAY